MTCQPYITASTSSQSRGGSSSAAGFASYFCYADYAKYVSHISRLLIAQGGTGPLPLRSHTFRGHLYDGRRFSLRINGTGVLSSSNTMTSQMRIKLMLESIVTFRNEAAEPHKCSTGAMGHHNPHSGRRHARPLPGSVAGRNKWSTGSRCWPGVLPPSLS